MDSKIDKVNNKQYHIVDQLQQHVSFELMKELRHVFVYHHWLIITIQEELMIEGDKITWQHT